MRGPSPGVYDCVIVGARCAGAPLAHFLARAGKRVIVVDAAALPSDQPLSTHFIHPYGMRILDELGLGDRVREVAPPVHVFRTGIGAHVVRLTFAAGGGGCCPRRRELDAILVDGARAAGAEVRARCRVVDVLRDGARVAGVIVDEDGVRSELRARLVVGADGRHSTIAALVGAEEYRGYDCPRAIYWAYWPRPAWYADDPAHEGGTRVQYDGEELRVAFPTNRDQLLLAYSFPNTGALAEVKADPAASLMAAMRAHPVFAPLAAGPPLGKTIGLVKARFFLRQAAGPGWALVGDAGLCQDPSPGLGITDALRDAKALAAAILADTEDALTRYWRERDVEALPLFYWARDMGGLDYDNAFNRLCYARIAAAPHHAQRLVDVVERRLSPYDAFTPRTILGWTGAALLRGHFGVLGPLFRAGRVGAEVAKAVKHAREECARLPPR